MKINIIKLSDTAAIPTRGSEEAAGYDLYADEDVLIRPFRTKKIKTNISLEIPPGYFGAIYPRSGLSINKGLRLANCVGVIDSDYRGNIIVALHNDNDRKKYLIKKGDRIAQIIIQQFSTVEFNESDKIQDTKRGDGGLGSTGIN